MQRSGPEPASAAGVALAILAALRKDLPKAAQSVYGFSV